MFDVFVRLKHHGRGLANRPCYAKYHGIQPPASLTDDGHVPLGIDPAIDYPVTLGLELGLKLNCNTV